MHVVHLTASSFFGGPERQMLGLAAALPAHVATTFVSFSEGGRCRPFLQRAHEAGFDAAELLHDTPRFREAIREITAFLQGNDARVLVTHGYKSNLLGRAAARQVGLPAVSVARGWTGESWKVRLYELADRFRLKHFDRVVCVSEGQARKVRRCGVDPARLRVIRNAARLEAFESPPRQGRERLAALAGGAPVVLAAGRLSPEKGFHHFVEAVALVAEAHPDARFVLAGDGPQQCHLAAQIRARGLESRLVLAGFRPDLDTMLPWADLVVLPSLTEGLPNVALEASAAGVPVVATAVGGTPEVVADGETGYLVPPRQPPALAQRIGELLADEARRRAFGLAGRRRMEREFSFAGQAEAYTRLFDELVGREAVACD